MDNLANWNYAVQKLKLEVRNVNSEFEIWNLKFRHSKSEFQISKFEFRTEKFQSMEQFNQMWISGYKTIVEFFIIPNILLGSMRF